MYIIHTEIALQCAHHLFTETINRLPLETPSKLIKAGQGSVQEGQCYQCSREWICFQCTWQASVQTHDDISHSQDHTSIFTCSCNSIGQPIHMVYTLLPLSQERLQLFLSLDMHMANIRLFLVQREKREYLNFPTCSLYFQQFSLSFVLTHSFPGTMKGHPGTFVISRV